MLERILLTGGSGFVGSYLARRAVASGATVHLALRPGHGRWRLEGLPTGVELHELDLGDPAAVGELFASTRPQAVWHLAAFGAYADQRDLRPMVETNVLATYHLLEAAATAGVEAFVHAGSSSEYGFCSDPSGEEALPRPNSPYAATKVAATMACGHYARDRGVPAVVLRLYSVYGPWEEPRRLIPTLLLRTLEGGLPPLVSPDVARDFIHVEDVAAAFDAATTQAAQLAGEVFNVGSGEQVTIRELAELAIDRFELAVEPEFGVYPNRRWDTGRWEADPRRARDRLGWEARIGLGEGLARFRDWLEEEPARLDRYRRGAGVISEGA